MCAEKTNDKSEKTAESSSCEGMTELMKNCCPGGRPDCITKMKEVKDKFTKNKNNSQVMDFKKIKNRESMDKKHRSEN